MDRALWEPAGDGGYEHQPGPVAPIELVRRTRTEPPCPETPATGEGAQFRKLVNRGPDGKPNWPTCLDREEELDHFYTRGLDHDVVRVLDSRYISDHSPVLLHADLPKMTRTPSRESNELSS